MADENNSADLGGLNIHGNNPDSGTNPAGAAGSASAEVIKERKKRSDIGKPRGSRTGTGNAGVSSLSTLTPQAFAALYDEKLWARVLASPADAAAAVTGAKEWELSEEERTTLGKTGSVAAQCFAVSDPRYLALSLAIICLSDIYAVRFVMWKARRDAEKKIADKKSAT